MARLQKWLRSNLLASIQRNKKIRIYSNWLLVLICLTIVSPAIGQSKNEFGDAIALLSKESPAGGPIGNKTAAIVVFFRVSKTLCWLENRQIVKVEVTPTRETDDTKESGPTPLGEFLIGERYTHSTHKIDWYKLYPRLEDNKGYYGYTAKTKSGRSAMGLHPGAVSEGCVTVTSNSRPYDASLGWQRLKKHLDEGKLEYKNDTFVGFLYVIDK